MSSFRPNSKEIESIKYFGANINMRKKNDLCVPSIK